MKIHRLGNDYVQVNKFKKESVSNVENQTSSDRPEPSEQVSAEATEQAEAETIPEAKEKHQGRKKKQSN